jgi:hypothetical protein
LASSVGLKIIQKNGNDFCMKKSTKNWPKVWAKKRELILDPTSIFWLLNISRNKGKNGNQHKIRQKSGPKKKETD